MLSESTDARYERQSRLTNILYRDIPDNILSHACSVVDHSLRWKQISNANCNRLNGSSTANLHATKTLFLSCCALSTSRLKPVTCLLSLYVGCFFFVQDDAIVQCIRDNGFDLG